MYTGLVHMHNLLRWVIVITLILSLINAFKGKNGKEIYDEAVAEIDKIEAEMQQYNVLPNDFMMG